MYRAELAMALHDRETATEMLARIEHIALNADETGRAAPTFECIYALLDKTSGSEFGIRLGAKAEEDPLGIRNHTLELTLTPPVGSAPQQFQLQTSTTDKLIQPWGLPQT